jgi:hypothetical protein
VASPVPPRAPVTAPPATIRLSSHVVPVRDGASIAQRRRTAQATHLRRRQMPALTPCAGAARPRRAATRRRPRR